MPILWALADPKLGEREVLDMVPGPLKASPVRVAQRVLALAAAIRHSFHNGQAVNRSLIAYDH